MIEYNGFKGNKEKKEKLGGYHDSKVDSENSGNQSTDLRRS